MLLILLEKRYCVNLTPEFLVDIPLEHKRG